MNEHNMMLDAGSGPRQRVVCETGDVPSTLGSVLTFSYGAINCQLGYFFFFVLFCFFFFFFFCFVLFFVLCFFFGFECSQIDIFCVGSRATECAGNGCK